MAYTVKANWRGGKAVSGTVVGRIKTFSRFHRELKEKNVSRDGNKEKAQKG